MKKDKKYILIIILLLIVLGLAGAYILFGPNGYKTTEKGNSFVTDTMELQATLSYYVGSTYSDAFGLYSKVEVLSGITEEGEKVKDNEDNLLPALINLDEAIDYKSEKAYKLNLENVKTTLGVDISGYEGVNFYVVEGDLIRVKMDTTPEWWSNNFDGLVIK